MLITLLSNKEISEYSITAAKQFNKLECVQRAYLFSCRFAKHYLNNNGSQTGTTVALV